MARILKRDFTDEIHCGRCMRGRHRLDAGIAYFFVDRGPQRVAGPHCAKRDANNWNSFPDFTRAFADFEREVEEALAADATLDQAIACADEVPRGQCDGVVARHGVAAKQQTEVLGGPRLRAVLEYLGLRVKLSESFSIFPCPPFLLELQRKVDRSEALSSREGRAVLQAAVSYRRINKRATPNALQACYALDVALDRLVAHVGPGKYPSKIQQALRRTGQLTERQDDGLRKWFAPLEADLRIRMPNTRPILR